MEKKDILDSISIPEYWQICVAHYVNVRDDRKKVFLLTMQTMNMTVKEIADSRRGTLIIYKWTNPKYDENEEFLTTKWLNEMNPPQELREHILSNKNAVPIVNKLHYNDSISVYKPFTGTDTNTYSKNILFSLSTNDLSFQQEYANAVTFTGDFSLQNIKLLEQDTSKECYRFVHTQGMNDKIRIAAMQDIFDYCF